MRKKTFLDLSLSELGVGTYLGDLDEKTSQGYREVIREAFKRANSSSLIFYSNHVMFIYVDRS